MMYLDPNMLHLDMIPTTTRTTVETSGVLLVRVAASTCHGVGAAYDVRSSVSIEDWTLATGHSW